QQYNVSSNTWFAVIEGGSGKPQDFPFEIHGREIPLASPELPGLLDDPVATAPAASHAAAVTPAPPAPPVLAVTPAATAASAAAPVAAVPAPGAPGSVMVDGLGLGDVFAVLPDGA